MWKALIVVLALAASAGAQPFRDLLLPEARHITGVVVDAAGKPVAGARVDHSTAQVHVTDSDGRFELDTRAPSVVVRKAGFRSAHLFTGDATDVRVTLQAFARRPFQNCLDTSQFNSIQDWGAYFWFPKLPGVQASPQASDVDYGMRGYFVDTPQGPQGIRHGKGIYWSFGIPSDGDVWRSVTYEEITFDQGDAAIVDARGQLTDGSRWRYLGKFGESADYSKVDETTAKILDQVLDGICLNPGKPR